MRKRQGGEASKGVVPAHGKLKEDKLEEDTVIDSSIRNGFKYREKPGKIPDILPLGYVYPFYQDPSTGSKLKRRTSKSRGSLLKKKPGSVSRSKSIDELEESDYSLRFQVDLILARNENSNRKKASGSKNNDRTEEGDGLASNSVRNTKSKKGLENLFKEFINKSQYRLKRNEELQKSLKYHSDRDSVLFLLMEIMKLEEEFQAQLDRNKSKEASREQQLIEKEERLVSETKTINNKLEKFIESAKATVTEYETKIEKLKEENQEILTSKLRLEEEVVVLGLAHSDKVQELLKELNQLTNENLQFKASASHLDLKYIDLMSQKLKEAEKLLDEERMKAAVSNQRYEQEIYDTQVELVKARNVIKGMLHEKEDMEMLLKDRNLLLSNLNTEIINIKNKSEGKIVLDLKERIVGLEKTIIIKEDEIEELKREFDTRQAKSKMSELMSKNVLEQQLQKLKKEKEVNEMKLSEDLLSTREEIVRLKKAGRAHKESTDKTIDESILFRVEESKLTVEEVKAMELKITVLEKKIKESEILSKQKYENELDLKDSKILKLEEELRTSLSKGKSEETKKLTLERIILSMSSASRLRKEVDFGEFPEGLEELGLSMNPKIQERVKESPFLKLLDQMKAERENNSEAK